MLFCKVENDNAVEWLITERELRARLAQYSLPSELTDEILNPLGYAILEDIDPTTLPKSTKDLQAVLSSVERTETPRWRRIYTLEPVPDSIKEERLASKWAAVRAKRDKLMRQFEWRLSRFDRQVRLGLPTSDDQATLDRYMQALADITASEDPYLIEFPKVPDEIAPA